MTTWFPIIALAASTITSESREVRVCSTTVALPPVKTFNPELYPKVVAVNVSVPDNKLVAIAFVVQASGTEMVPRRVSVTATVAKVNDTDVVVSGSMIEEKVPEDGTVIASPPVV